MSVIDDLKAYEGFRAKPYKCSEGFLTIGYGINLDAGIDKEEAQMLLEYRVKKVSSKLMNLSFWDKLSDNRKDVLINMAYNLGFDGLMKFQVTLKMIADGNYVEASKQMLKSKWAKQVGDRAIWLSNKMRLG